ncbi:MAG TPA: LTA synthase family protein, partial [Croceibacterium sp.]
MQRAAEPRSGRTQFALAFRLALGGLAGCVVLQVLLYVRPAPHGGPFLAEWPRYFWLALYYEMLGVWLLSLPFFVLWLGLFRSRLESRLWRALSGLHAALLALNLVLSQLDHEVLRFLGVRANLSFLYAYGQPEMLGDALFRDVLADDRGGPFVGVALMVIVPGAYAWWAVRRLRRGAGRTAPLWLALVLALVPLLAPANGWHQASSHFRLRKVEPLVIALAMDARAGYADWQRPADFTALAAGHAQRWLARSGDKAWRFPDPERPYWREPTGAAPELDRWNVLYLQLETFRGIEMGALDPAGGPTATPFLDGFVARPGVAVWTRASSLGNPSINGLFAAHCSVQPPSRHYITSYTDVRFGCLPERLRERGYRTVMFNGGDTDWDNSSPWIARWYDRLRRFPEAEGRDRVVFRAAAQELRALGRGGEPFFASVVSISNHWPFETREPALDIAGQATPAERIRNTTHYMDDVLREFFAAIENEPWYARTLVVIAGDHGFNAGEHGLSPGRQDLYRESVWVPLIVAGPHPRLPAGRHDMPASLLD